MSIVFTDFSFRFDSQEKPTLKNINLKIVKGEKILIIGPSGSGKSTLGQCLNGLIPQAIKGEMSGSLTINGQDSAKFDMHDYSKRLGTVLQDTDDQFVGLSIGEDIAFALENQLTANIDMYPIVKATATLVELEQMLTSSPQDLSGGQKQRVSLAGVLVDDVDILLFDEPLAALDPKTSRKTIEIIDDLHKKTSKTIIIIEHRLEEVLHRNVDRVILIDKGEIISDCSPAKLLRSSLLTKYGIREPLYISALKAANCKIDPETDLSHIDNLPLSSYRWDFLSWFSSGKHSSFSSQAHTLLSLESVSYSYDGEKNVLENINLQIKKGEFVSILGKNGSGKSTLTKLLIGVIEADKGEMFFNNHSLSKLSVFQRCQKIGLVMQNPNHMISHHLIFDEIAFGLRNRGLCEDEVATKVFDVLELCGLSKFKHWPIKALSYGQKKRVTIASILVLEPELLILDEPTAGQDYDNYSSIMGFVKSLNQQLGITVIIISHDMHLSLEYANRSIVFAEGQIIADAQMSDIFSHQVALDKANLCVTSLFALATKLGLDTKDFIQHFIDTEIKPKSDKVVIAQATEIAEGNSV